MAINLKISTKYVLSWLHELSTVIFSSSEWNESVVR